MFGNFALTVAALFTGAAFYINFAEQPARLALDDRALLQEWKPAYKRGFTMQASLAVIGFVLGLMAYWESKQPLWIFGAVLLVANWPYTLFFIMPVNKILEATPPEAAGSQTRRLIEDWGRLHAGRTALGALATVFFIWALS
jgi:hypothetical protein